MRHPEGCIAHDRLAKIKKTHVAPYGRTEHTVIFSKRRKIKAG